MASIVIKAEPTDEESSASHLSLPPIATHPSYAPVSTHINQIQCEGPVSLLVKRPERGNGNGGYWGDKLHHHGYGIGSFWRQDSSLQAWPHSRPTTADATTRLLTTPSIKEEPTESNIAAVSAPNHNGYTSRPEFTGPTTGSSIISKIKEESHSRETDDRLTSAVRAPNLQIHPSRLAFFRDSAAAIGPSVCSNTREGRARRRSDSRERSPSRKITSEAVNYRDRSTISHKPTQANDPQSTLSARAKVIANDEKLEPEDRIRLLMLLSDNSKAWVTQLIDAHINRVVKKISHVADTKVSTTKAAIAKSVEEIVEEEINFKMILLETIDRSTANGQMAVDRVKNEVSNLERRQQQKRKSLPVAQNKVQKKAKQAVPAKPKKAKRSEKAKARLPTVCPLAQAIRTESCLQNNQFAVDPTTTSVESTRKSLSIIAGNQQKLEQAITVEQTAAHNTIGVIRPVQLHRTGDTSSTQQALQQNSQTGGPVRTESFDMSCLLTGLDDDQFYYVDSDSDLD